MTQEALKLALEALEEATERYDIFTKTHKRAITAIKEALAGAEGERQQSNEQVEPVGEAYLCDLCHTPFDGEFQCPSCGHGRATKEPVYTTPPQRKPLTDEQILHFVDIHVGAPSMAYPLDNSDWITFARAVEAAHGIKE